jgi:hypothetical protein
MIVIYDGSLNIMCRRNNGATCHQIAATFNASGNTILNYNCTCSSNLNVLENIVGTGTALTI